MDKSTILITGADGGLGITVTENLLLNGYALIAATKDQAAADRLQKAFPQQFGTQLIACITDLAAENDVQHFAGLSQNPYGLVHLAGGYKPGNTIAEYTDADFSFLFDLNTRPTFLLLKHVLPKMKADGAGSIITVGAKPALHPVAGNAVYTASKSAVIALTLSAAEEGRTSGVRANCIVPAALQTPGNLSWASKEQFDTFTPLTDVAATIQYLLSDAGKGVNGTVIPMYNKIPS